MIRLFQFPRAAGLPNPSPFCMKLETFLRMAKLDYEIKEMMDPRKGPKGKFPFIEADGRRIGDSTLAIRYLEKTRDLKLGQGMSPEKAALGEAVTRMIEEHLYWVVVYSRWIDDDHWPAARKAFFGSLPFPLSHLLPTLARRQTKAQLWAQGIGRHEKDEVYDMGHQDVRAVAVCLGDNPYFLGTSPSVVDCTVYAFLAGILQSTLSTPLTSHALRFDNLLPYCERMQQEFFPEFGASDPSV